MGNRVRVIDDIDQYIVPPKNNIMYMGKSPKESDKEEIPLLVSDRFETVKNATVLKTSAGKGSHESLAINISPGTVKKILKMINRMEKHHFETAAPQKFCPYDDYHKEHILGMSWADDLQNMFVTKVGKHIKTLTEKITPDSVIDYVNNTESLTAWMPSSDAMVTDFLGLFKNGVGATQEEISNNPSIATMILSKLSEKEAALFYETFSTNFSDLFKKTMGIKTEDATKK